VCLVESIDSAFARHYSLACYFAPFFTPSLLHPLLPPPLNLQQRACPLPLPSSHISLHSRIGGEASFNRAIRSHSDRHLYIPSTLNQMDDKYQLQFVWYVLPLVSCTLGFNINVHIHRPYREPNDVVVTGDFDGVSSGCFIVHALCLSSL
jgi:hypothetical protein